MWNLQKKYHIGAICYNVAYAPKKMYILNYKKKFLKGKFNFYYKDSKLT